MSDAPLMRTVSCIAKRNRTDGGGKRINIACGFSYGIRPGRFLANVQSSSSYFGLFAVCVTAANLQVEHLLRGYVQGLQFLWKNRAGTIAIIKKEFNVNDAVANDALTSFQMIATKDGLVSDAAFDEAIEFAAEAEKTVNRSKLRDFTMLRQVLTDR